MILLQQQQTKITMDQPKSREEWLKIVENLMHGADIWDERYDYVMHDDHWLTSKYSPDCPKCQAEGKKPPVSEASIFNNNSTLKNIDINFNNGINNITTTQQAALPPMIVPITPIAPVRFQTRLGNGTFDRMRDKSALKHPGHDQNLIDLNETFDLYRSALEQTPQLNNQTPHQHQNQNNHNQQQQPSTTATSRIPKIPIRSSRP